MKGENPLGKQDQKEGQQGLLTHLPQIIQTRTATKRRKIKGKVVKNQSGTGRKARRNQTRRKIKATEENLPNHRETPNLQKILRILKILKIQKILMTQKILKTQRNQKTQRIQKIQRNQKIPKTRKTLQTKSQKLTRRTIDGPMRITGTTPTKIQLQENAANDEFHTGKCRYSCHHGQINSINIYHRVGKCRIPQRSILRRLMQYLGY